MNINLDKLKRIVEFENLTHVAEVTGVNKSTLYKIRKGKIKLENLTLETAKKLNKYKKGGKSINE